MAIIGGTAASIVSDHETPVSKLQITTASEKENLAGPKEFCDAFLFRVLPLLSSISCSPRQLPEFLSPASPPHAWRTTLIVNP